MDTSRLVISITNSVDNHSWSILTQLLNESSHLRSIRDSDFPLSHRLLVCHTLENGFDHSDVCCSEAYWQRELVSFCRGPAVVVSSYVQQGVGLDELDLWIFFVVRTGISSKRLRTYSRGRIHLTSHLQLAGLPTTTILISRVCNQVRLVSSFVTKNADAL